jgi:hypothetical protein
VGFDEDEATHFHSFKLIVPSLLGASKEVDKNDPKYPLPAVKDFASWNPQDNEGSVKKRLQTGMDDVSLAVTESINVRCIAHPAALKWRCCIKPRFSSTSSAAGLIPFIWSLSRLLGSLL